MSKQRSNEGSTPRWHVRPAGDGSDEDRAATLVRDALDPDAFPLGLDDRRLAHIGKRLRSGDWAGPPRWLRPAIVAALLMVGAASVLGYEVGWFAPSMGARLRVRSIPPAAREPVGSPRTPAPRSSRVPSDDPSDDPSDARMPVGSDAPAADESAAGAGEGHPPTSSRRLPPRAPVAKVTGAPPNRTLASADRTPPTPAAIEPLVRTGPSEEIEALERAMGELRGAHDARAALRGLDDYLARFPAGVFASEARVARVDALLMLDRLDEALAMLDALPLDANRRSTELQLIRGELRARTDCARAEADFTAVLSRARAPALEERALFGRAACRSTRPETPGATEDLRRYLARFPNGAHADWARHRLEDNR